MGELNNQCVDIAIIGGGINGAGIAALAAEQGFSVALFEQHDFASGTSSASSKLLHGGLRYLEHYQFRLVKEALAEREALMQLAPHLIKPLQFTLPIAPQGRAPWLLRAGLFLYDHLAPRQCLPATQKVKLSPEIFQSHYQQGYCYADCWLDDSRLTLANVLQAKQHGALMRNYCQVSAVKAHPSSSNSEALWQLQLVDKTNAQAHQYQLRCQLLINAAGPWVNQLFHQLEPAQTMPYQPQCEVRYIKGSHLVVPRIAGQTDQQAFILQHSDQRIIFILPYLDRFSLIGTTDYELTADKFAQYTEQGFEISPQEQEYLLMVVNQYLQQPIKATHIVHSFSGTRLLAQGNKQEHKQEKAAQNLSRDYQLILQHDKGLPPLLSVYGGKLSTYRKLAQACLNKIKPILTTNNVATEQTAFYGTDFPCAFADYPAWLIEHYPWLATQNTKEQDTKELCHRFIAQYGSRCIDFLTPERQQMGAQIAPNVYQQELNYAVAQQFVRTADDFLWRRSKLGLTLTLAEQQAVARAIQALVLQHVN